MLSGVDDIESSLEILLSTTVGSRVMQPRYGCNLKPYVHEPANNRMLAYIRKLVEDAILYFEPRILLDSVTLQGGPDDWLEGRIHLVVEYTIKSSNSRHNVVVPIHGTEGSGTP